MAWLNDIYIHVTDESVSFESEVSSHPVESGADITDNIKRGAAKLSISGKIVDYFDGSKWIAASDVLARIKGLQNNAQFVTFSGRNISYNLQITSLTTGHPNTISGGADFDMELQEIRIATNSYVEPVKVSSAIENGGTKQVEKADNNAIYHTVKRGDCVWNLVAKSNAPYKSLSRPNAETSLMGQCNWVLKENPTAFSRQNDFGTLQVGAKILVGYRE